MTAPAGNGGMTRAERDDLIKVVRLRARISRQKIKAREAELVAQAEEQLSKEWDHEDDLFKEVAREARRAAQEADEKIHQICKDRGIADELRPKIEFVWYSRGRNADRERRAELRTAARTAARAAAESAKVAIDIGEADVMTQIIAGGLETAEARAFLDTIPTPQQLMPVIDVKALRAGSDD